ncbi:MAG: GNAT family N-acetyltransferase [Rubrivivax sp.]
MSPASFRIRRSVPADAAGLVCLMEDEAVFGNLMQLPFPSLALWAERLGRAPEPDRCELSLVAERGTEVVASAGLYPAAPQLRRRHAAALGLCVATAVQRQGIGHALMQTLCSYADSWAQVLRIELTVFADNAPAIALYRRFGFETEGTHRAYALRGGRYVDALSMARLHPQPPSLPATPRGAAAPGATP